MLRFAKIDPRELEKINARDLDPIDLKERWIAMADEADAAIERVADAQPDLPIGCVFVDAEGQPGWIEDRVERQIHFGTMRGCVPRIHVEP